MIKSLPCPECHSEPICAPSLIAIFGNIGVHRCHRYECSATYIRSSNQTTVAFHHDFTPTNDVPERVLNVVSEAHLCFNVGAYRATVVTARAAIETLAEEQGVSEGTLMGRVNEVFGENNLIAEASYEIKKSGDGGAHDKEDVARNVAHRALTSLGAILSLTYREIRTPRMVTLEELQDWREKL